MPAWARPQLKRCGVPPMVTCIERVSRCERRGSVVIPSRGTAAAILPTRPRRCATDDQYRTREGIRNNANRRARPLRPRLTSGWVTMDLRSCRLTLVVRVVGDASENVAVRVASFDLERGVLLGGDHPGAEV